LGIHDGCRAGLREKLRNPRGAPGSIAAPGERTLNHPKYITHEQQSEYEGRSGTAKDKVEFWSRTSPTYDASVDASLGGNTRPLINELLEKEKDLGAVVEFGCGTGYFTRTLAERSESVIATDFSDDMLRIAGEHLKGCNNVRFLNVDWQHTPFADESFDTIFSGFVIPCVDDKVQALRESYRILKPGGKLIVANPNILLLSGPNKVRFLLRALIAWRGRLPPVSFRSVRALIEGTGFTLADLNVIQDPAIASGAPVEYVVLVRPRPART
jgi:ABC-2 type transport system ATP-binding protein